MKWTGTHDVVKSASANNYSIRFLQMKNINQTTITLYGGLSDVI